MVVITLVAIIVFLSLLVAPVRARCKIDPAPGNGHVEIPTSWKSIEANDFQNCTSLVSLSIPSNIIAIDVTSFSGCSGITKLVLDTPLVAQTNDFVNVYFPDSKDTVEELVLGDTVTELAEKTCYECSSLQTLTIGDNVTIINKFAFTNCELLPSVSVPDLVKTIGLNSFQGCSSLTTAVLGSSLQFIAAHAFSGCVNLGSITIPKMVEAIYSKAFYECTALTSVMLPSSLSFLGPNVFGGCVGLASVSIPSSVTAMDKTAFSGCPGITKLTLDTPLLETVKNFTAEYFPDSRATLEQMIIENTVTALADKTCSGCTALSTLKIGESVKSIGESAFASCSSLVSLTIPDSVETILSGCFYGCASLTALTVPNSVTTISSYLFSGCTSLASVEIGNSVTSVGMSAFINCKSLTSVKLPNSLTRVNAGTYMGCTSLASVSIPSSVTAMDKTAFSGCPGITKLTLDTPLLETVKNFTAEYFPDSRATLEQMIIENTVTALADKTCSGCTALSTLKIGENVERLGEGAFFGSALVSVVVPSTVTYIANGAFFGCKKLVSVSLSDALVGIGNIVFKNCYSLTNLVIPDFVATVGWGLCQDCRSLVSVTIGKSVPVISIHMFEGCSDLTTVSISDGVQKIAIKAFKSCTSLDSVVIPASVAIIDESAFESCTVLRSVTIGAGNELVIGPNAFGANNNLDVMTMGTKTTVNIAESAFEGSMSLKYISFSRYVRSIASIPERYGNIKCSGGTCMCTPGSENVLSAQSEFFACTVCLPGRFSSMASLGSCEACPAGKFVYESAAFMCDECPTGKYLDKEGMTLASDCLSCTAGSYGSNVGMSACTECPSGTYSTAVKATEKEACVECPLNTYTASGASSECKACPEGENTVGKKGASGCISEQDSLSLKNRADVLKLFQSGMAYMISFMGCLLFAAIGGLIAQIRSKNATLCPLPIFIICGRLSISALSIMSEAFMLAIMFSEGTTLFFRLGIVIVTARCLNIVPTVSILFALFGAPAGSSSSSQTTSASKYKKCFDSHHFLGKIYPYTLLSFLSLWDCQLIALLPWRYSDFAEKSRGFPDMLTLRTTSYYKIAQDLTRFVCNVIYLLNAVDEAADASVEVMTYFNMAASVATIVLAGMVAVMKNSVLIEVEAHKGTAADLSQPDTGGDADVHTIGSSKFPDVGADNGITDAELGLQSVELPSVARANSSDQQIYSSNPMHTRSGGDELDNHRISNSGSSAVPVLARLPPTATVRVLLMHLIPDIDGPGLHGATNAFRKDGVETLAELRTFLEGGLVGVDELKRYCTKGKLSMSQVFKLVTELSPYMRDKRQENASIALQHELLAELRDIKSGHNSAATTPTSSRGVIITPTTPSVSPIKQQEGGVMITPTHTTSISAPDIIHPPQPTQKEKKNSITSLTL